MSCHCQHFSASLWMYFSCCFHCLQALCSSQSHCTAAKRLRSDRLQRTSADIMEGSEVKLRQHILIARARFCERGLDSGCQSSRNPVYSADVQKPYQTGITFLTGGLQVQVRFQASKVRMDTLHWSECQYFDAKPKSESAICSPHFLTKLLKQPSLRRKLQISMVIY